MEHQKQKDYHVTWEIDIDADSPREAAELAQKMMRENTDWAFTVKQNGKRSARGTSIDLAVCEEDKGE